MFYDDQGDQVSSQTVKNGEYVTAPYDPPIDPTAPNKEFKGWFEGDDQDHLKDEPFDFSKPQVLTAESDTEIYLYAVFAEYAHVTFHGQYDPSAHTYPVVEVKRVELTDDPENNVINISDHTAPYYNTSGSGSFAEFQFAGWSHTAIPTAGQGSSDIITETTLPLTEDTDLYPVFKAVNWLSFVSGNSGTGATYYAPKAVQRGDKLDQSVIVSDYIPVRPGYEFKGWYLGVENEGTDAQNGCGTQITEADGTLLAAEDDEKGIKSIVNGDSYLLLSKNVTVYARWEAVEVDYKVVIWKQRATDAYGLAEGKKSYDYAESFTLKAYPYSYTNTPASVGGNYIALNNNDAYNAVHDSEHQLGADPNPYSGFVYNADKTLTDTDYDINTHTYKGTKNIAYEGNTVFNVYYDHESGHAAAAYPEGNYTVTFIYPAELSTADSVVTVGVTSSDPIPSLGSITVPGITDEQKKEGYAFNWYADESCTTRVFFNEDDYNIYNDGGKVLYSTVPYIPGSENGEVKSNLNIYGGWEKEWYLIQIDTNMGEMHKDNTNSTYFWKTYKSDYIQEYTWITRDYIESESGEWYYVQHDYTHPGDNRWTYYSQDLSEATSLTKYKYEPGMYFSAGWYEVKEDGSEEPYVFGSPITGYTTIRLHWKLSGTYYLHYNTDVTVDGQRMTGTNRENSVLPSTDGYTDQAKAYLNVIADAPEGYAFGGWVIRGDKSGKIYHPGDEFTVDGEFSATVNGKKNIYLDAVYIKIRTVSVVYDANGGTVTNSADAGAPTDRDGNPLHSSKYSVSRNTADGTVTVSGIVNNSGIKLSSGDGFSFDSAAGAVFSGWNTEPDGSGKHFNAGAFEDERGKYYADVNEPVTLYAEWKIRVRFDKNDTDASYSADGWDGYEQDAGVYYIDTFINAELEEPSGTVTKDDLTLDFWSKTSGGAEEGAYDFKNIKLTASMTLYAHLTDAARIPFHVTSSNKVDRDEWKRTDLFRVSSQNGAIDLTDANSVRGYLKADEGYSFDYVCLSADTVGISSADDCKAVSLSKDASEVKATLANGDTVVLDADGKDANGRYLHIVYKIENEDQRIKLAYVKSGEAGVLSSVTPVTYNTDPFTFLNGSLVPGTLSGATAENGAIDGENHESGQIIKLGSTPLEISQNLASGVFNAPPLLDDPGDLSGDKLTLVHDGFGVGAAGADNISGISNFSNKLYLRYYDGKRQVSADGTTWTSFTGDTLYVVYRERGFELVITKAVTGDNTGISPDMSFTVTIESTAITRSSFLSEGTGYSSVSAVPASGGNKGKITLNVKDGSEIHIHGLHRGTYTVTENHNNNYLLVASVVNDAAEQQNDSIEFTIDKDKTVMLVNEPKYICRVWNQRTLSYEAFYTLNSAMTYAHDQLDGAAEIQMLHDYVVPDWDVVEIPAGFEITLTSKDSSPFVISREDAYTSVPVFTNYGTFSLENVVLDGNGYQTGCPFIYNVGTLTIGDKAEFRNAKTAGNGAAIYQERGSLTVNSGAKFSGNTAVNGGDIYANSGKVVINGGEFYGFDDESVNKAENGGAIYYAGNDSLTVSGGSFNGCRVSSNGGAIYAVSGALTVSGGSFGDDDGDGDDTTDLKGNRAENGGAIYTESADLKISGGTFSHNTATENGGAVYAEGGEANLTAGNLNKNKANNGGAIYSDSATLTIGGGTLNENSAVSYGGAVYSNTGATVMTAGTIGADGKPNSAVNGAGFFTNAGTAAFSGGTVTKNASSDGGAIGVGSDEARLTFSGNIKVTENTKGTDESNVYLDRDSDDVISSAGLGNNASVGVYVSDGVMSKRGVPGAKFASYTDEANKAKIKNDRDPSFAIVSESSSKKLYWGKAIKVKVIYLKENYISKGFPLSGYTGNKAEISVNNYYPVMSGSDKTALSSIAEDMYKNNLLSGLSLSATAAYAGAYIDGTDVGFEEYVTKLWWKTDGADKGWNLTKHYDDNTNATNTAFDSAEQTLVLLYAEPAYVAIENNTDMALNISDIQLGSGDKIKNVKNTKTYAGYGMVFAKNGAIRSELLPVGAADLTLKKGESVTLLIPGGRNMSYQLTGQFSTSEAMTVPLKRGQSGQSGLTPETLSVESDGSFATLSGTTLDKNGTYQIVFGNEKMICKIVDSNGIDVPYSKISSALEAVKTGSVSLSTSKTAVIEMLTDYLLPSTDVVKIPRGYDITLTTAAKGVTNPYTGEGDRAVISRDSDNKLSMVDAWDNAVKAMDNTVLRIKDLVFDGKSVQGNSDGGAVTSKFANVYIDHVDFRNVYASNGGAMLVMFSDKDKNAKTTVPGTVMEVRNSNFTGCTSTTTVTSNRLGGGAIVTNAETMNLHDCVFDTCSAVDQAGAVFHRVDANYDSWATITGCTFTNCRANAAGGLELDSKTILVVGCRFEHCLATTRNGGGFNVYALNSAEPTVDCSTTVINCSFDDCHLTLDSASNTTGNGGGFRSTSKYTKVINTSFNNTSAIKGNGGAIGLSNKSAATAEIYGCTINGCRAKAGGGIYSEAKELTIGGQTVYTYRDGSGSEFDLVEYNGKYWDMSGKKFDISSLTKVGERIKRSEVKNCTALNSNGGGVSHIKDADGSKTTVTNADITGNTSSTSSGGGVYIYRVRNATFTGCNITKNTAKVNGGGIFIGDNNATRSLIIDSTKIEDNTAGGNGGGIYASYADLTLRNNVVITSNRLSTNPSDMIANVAGVFISDNRKLILGQAGSSAADHVVVRENTTASGALSDLRLWWNNNNKVNNSASVSVLSSLDDTSEIRVVNPGKETTQFGTRADTSFDGFTEVNHVFVADQGGLYGVYDRGTPANLIWRGGVICKITDQSGRLLYLDAECKDPAVFDRLDHRTNGNKLSPFSYLRQDNPLLYRKIGSEITTIDLTQEEIRIKMLVNTFETDTYIETGSYPGRKLVTLMTASNTESDGYPYTGRAGTFATIKRGYNDNSKTLLTSKINLTLRNITLDGGSADKTNPRSTTASGGLINASKTGTTGTTDTLLLTLAANSVLQNCRISNGSNGGAVCLNNGVSLEIAGGAIYNCGTVSGLGGGVYKTGVDGKITFTSGIISHCFALSGGGVYFREGTSFDMSGGAQITSCTANEKGGGVYIGTQRIMNMSGGFITNNHAGGDNTIGEGGGIYLGDNINTRLNLSRRVTVTNNTAVKNEDGSAYATVACNVELTNDSNEVIRSVGTGVSRNSNIGVYVPGVESPGDDPLKKKTTKYDKHGIETKPFGKFDNILYTNYLYCFLNDRNGLKGGLQLGDNECIHWVKIFSLQVKKTVISGDDFDLTREEFKFKVTFSRDANGVAPIYGFNTQFKYDGKFDDNGDQITESVENGSVVLRLKNGESATVDDLPAEVDNGNLYYKVEEIFDDDLRKEHYITSTARSSCNVDTQGDHYVVGRIGENLQRNDVNSKYTSYAAFDNLNAVCKLTTSKNGGALLYTYDPVSEKPVPAIYSTLHSNAGDGAFDDINARTDLYYWDVFLNSYKQFDYSGEDELRVEMLVENYSMKQHVELENAKATLTTAKSNATDGFPYTGANGTTAVIKRGSSGDNTNTNGWPMFLAANGLTLENIELDGENEIIKFDGNLRYVTTERIFGGIICVVSTGNLTVRNGAVLKNSSVNAQRGAAVYVSEKASMTMNGGTMKDNVCTNQNGDGAGIYLNAFGADSAKLYISGNPVFENNMVKKNGYSGKENGHDATVYTGTGYVPQDIYLKENHENAPASIIVTGDLTGADGSIWVWAQESVHYKTLMPFASLADGVVFSETPTGGQFNSAHLKVFRNARTDTETDNETETYLFGKMRDDYPRNVCWSGIEGSAQVILVKVIENGESFKALSGKSFTVYNSSKTRVAKGKVLNDNGGEEEIELTKLKLISGSGGAFFIGKLSYGKYYVEEDGVTNKHFEITIDKGGVVNVSGTGSNKVITRRKLVELVNN